MNTAWKVGLVVAGIVVVGVTAALVFGGGAKAPTTKTEVKPEEATNAPRSEETEVPSDEVSEDAEEDDRDEEETLTPDTTVQPALERLGKSVNVTEVKVKRSGMSESSIFRAYNRMCRQLHNKLPFHRSEFEKQGQIVYFTELTSHPPVPDIVISPKRYIKRILDEKGFPDPAEMIVGKRPLALYVIERNRTNTARPVLVIRDGEDYYLLGMRDRSSFIFSAPFESEMKRKTGADIFPLLLEMFKPILLSE